MIVWDAILNETVIDTWEIPKAATSQDLPDDVQTVIDDLYDIMNLQDSEPSQKNWIAYRFWFLKNFLRLKLKDCQK